MTIQIFMKSYLHLINVITMVPQYSKGWEIVWLFKQTFKKAFPIWFGWKESWLMTICRLLNPLADRSCSNEDRWIYCEKSGCNLINQSVKPYLVQVKEKKAICIFFWMLFDMVILQTVVIVQRWISNQIAMLFNSSVSGTLLLESPCVWANACQICIRSIIITK